LTDSTGMPKVRVHGLAATGFYVLRRYPWFSADSSSWRKAAAYGKVFIPKMPKFRNEGFDFSRPPCVIGVSHDSPTQEKRGQHLYSLNRGEQRHVKRWFDRIGVPLGKVDEEGEMTEWGLVSHHNARGLANAHYFIELGKSIPKWPWPIHFKSKRRLF